MRAGEGACACPECGVVCEGQFDGCPDVWARGPRPVSLTITPALAIPRLRALAPGSGPAPTQPQPASPAPAPAKSNGNSNGNGNGNGSAHGNGYGAQPPPPPPPPPGAAAGRPTAGAGPARTEVLRWFEEAFDELRNELHAVVSGVTRQQAMLAELLDSREAELRVVMVAESLPVLAGEAAAKALNDQSDGLADVVADSLDEFRASLRAADLSTVAVMDGMRELLRRVEITAEVNLDDARLDGEARLEAVKRSVGRQLRPVADAVTELAAFIEVADEREAARTKALKASVSRQLQPLTAAVEEAVDRSDRQLAEIHARLDAMGAPKLPAARTPAAPAKRAAPAERAPAKRAPARAKAAPRRAETTKPTPAPKPAAEPAAGRTTRARAATPAPGDTTRARAATPAPADTAILYDYEAPPAPPPVLESLLARRRAATRRPPPID